MSVVVLFLVSPDLWNDQTRDRQVALFVLGFLIFFVLWEFAVWATRGWLARDWPPSDDDRAG